MGSTGIPKSAICINRDHDPGTLDEEEPEVTTLKKGDSAPTFDLVDQDGKHMKLAGFKMIRALS
jgi:hypothetical protein